MTRTPRLRQVATAVAEWRAQLINVDATNRLLYYKDLKVGTLDLVDANLIRVAQLRGGQPVRLGRLFEDPARLITAQRSARQIATKARAAEEEFGVPISFVAAGLATWDDGRATSQPAGRSSPAPAQGPEPVTRRVPVPAAPVLLQAVEFEARPGTPDGYQLSTLGDAFVNPVLVHVLSTQFGVDIDEAELLEAGGDDPTVFALLTKACQAAEVPAFGVTDRVLIGTFSYLKQPMVTDLDDEQVEFLAENDLIAAIAGVAEARDAVRGAGGEVSETAPDYEPPVSEFLVLDADASQSYVINAASAGQNLVVQGPPGTGKSQTIANLIADLVAHGKSVLFVAQKRAAITAVLRRLDQVGLAGLVLDMFEGGGSRKSVVANLGRALEEKAYARTVNFDALHDRWTAARDQLTAHQTALHEQRSPWNVTVWELLAVERRLAATAASQQRVPASALKAWTSTTADQAASAAAELAAAGGNDPSLLHRSGWGIDAFSTLDEVSTAHDLAEHIRRLALPHAYTALTVMTRGCGLRSAGSIPDAAVPLQLLDDTVEAMAAGCAPGLSSQLTDERVQNLISATAPREWRKAQGVTMSWSERRAAKKATRLLFGKEADLATANARLGRAQQLRAAWRALGAPGVPATPASGLAETHDALRRLDETLRALQQWIQGQTLRDMPFAELDIALQNLITDQHRTRLPRIHQLRDQLRTADLGNVLAELDEHAPDPATADGRIRYVFAMSVTDHVLTSDPRLAGISRTQLDRWAAEFFTTDQERLTVNASRVRRITAESMTATLNDFPDQHAEIKRQVRRKRGYSSVRRLFHDAPQVLVAIKPCWAMSPLMVSQILPASRLFDIVIFDEASQVMPADAIPAIARAAQIVVAGDRHQLPPTDFFSRLSVVDDADSEPSDEETDEPEEELGTAAPETRDVESILDTLDVVLAGRSRTLTWHYRSKDEKLIATSNAYVYQHQLITFPGADGADRIRYEPVEFSTGIGRNNKSPAAEVTRVVELAVAHARARPHESLGIIAFGSDHAARIERALDVRLQEEPDLQPYFQQSGDEPFFIKNIERVQGDEREAIILTVGYGKANDGRMRYMWGPLLTQGGQRRLNVAISRARSRMTLVTSFAASDLDPTANNSAGFQLMYRFVQFMSSDGGSFGDNPGRDVELNPFEADVLYYLTSAGLSLEPQWGVGHYRIDFAARHPDTPGRFVLAIECDGAMYHSGIVARERDRIRQQHLERLGWRFHRIWSTDWWYDPRPQIDSVLASYRQALADIASHAIYDESESDSSEPIDADQDHQAADAPVAAPSRSGPVPRIYAGSPITDYTHRQLVALIRWIKSDDIVRTEEELLDTAVIHLGYRRRGQRIIDALQAAIADA